jgi:hypothetical protein
MRTKHPTFFFFFSLTHVTALVFFFLLLLLLPHLADHVLHGQPMRTEIRRMEIRPSLAPHPPLSVAIFDPPENPPDPSENPQNPA